MLWLIVAFFNAAGLMLLLGAEFIAMLLVIVYVGAVAVLFLFVVMMLDIDFAQLRPGLTSNLPFGMLIAPLLLAEIIFATIAWQAGPTLSGAGCRADRGTRTSSRSASSFTAAIRRFRARRSDLLVAMIGAIVLTHRSRGDTRTPKASPPAAPPSGRGGQGASDPGVGEGMKL